jgi:hypothetical protein
MRHVFRPVLGRITGKRKAMPLRRYTPSASQGILEFKRERALRLSRVAAAALVRRGDAHVFAVFGYGAPCQLDALHLEERG